MNVLSPVLRDKVSFSAKSSTLRFAANKTRTDDGTNFMRDRQPSGGSLSARTQSNQAPPLFVLRDEQDRTGARREGKIGIERRTAPVRLLSASVYSMQHHRLASRRKHMQSESNFGNRIDHQRWSFSQPRLSTKHPPPQRTDNYGCVSSLSAST